VTVILVRHPFSEHLCPKFQTAMEVLARPWNGLVMAMLEDNGPLRFSELRERLPAIGDRMLAARLRELEARGIVERTVVAGPPVRVTYALTAVGRGFRAVEQAIGRWGERLVAAAPARRQQGRRERARVEAPGRRRLA
jgi:DNA-binding HxlR family transcriptional regulator